MTPNDYLKALLESQKLEEGSKELADLRRHREEVESLIRAKFPTPTIRYAGSKAKGTMIRESYDLDLPCYFANDDASAGDTLEEIFDAVKAALAESYWIEEKASAIRLRSRDMKTDFHIDVVPGRFTDDSETDVFLHRTTGDKARFKTNLQVHIDHVRASGVTDAISLLKLWRKRSGVILKTFVLELIAVELIGGSGDDLDRQLLDVLTELAERPEQIVVEDPANPSGNDLSDLWSEPVRAAVSEAAQATLSAIRSSGWEAAFGRLPDPGQIPVTDALRRAAQASPSRNRPWRR
jgi:hypothetical protein